MQMMNRTERKNHMKTRKLVLLIADLVLLAICVTQCVFLSADSGKTFKLKETPDEIVIRSGDNEVVLSFENNEWVVGQNKYETNMSAVDSIIDSLTSVRCIEKVGSISKANNEEKYELTDDKKIEVIATKEGELLRTLNIGKTGSTGSQNFITIDGGSDIWLATGGLGYDFDVTENEVRTKTVWDFDTAEISSVEVRRPDGLRYTVSKTGSGSDLSWTVSGADIDLDAEKAQSWFDTLGYMQASVWLDEKADLGGSLIATTSINHGFETTLIDVYEIPAASEDDYVSYYGICNENPYPFELSSGTMEKINKNPEELAK